MDLSLVRLDASLVERIRREESLLALALRAVGTIALGAGLYGLAFGAWRAPMAALYSALKLPALFLGVALLTTLASGLLAPVLRSRLSLRQTAVAILVSFAVSSALLGALAPASLLVVLMQPPLDPAAVGLPGTDPLVAPSIATAQSLVLFHTAVIALAGAAGVFRLMGLLGRLEPRLGVVRRVVLTWLGLQFLVGSELAWTMRPFLGRPHLPLAFLSREALEGSFFEEILLLSRAAFGLGAPLVLAVFGLVLVVWLTRVLRVVAEPARIEVGHRALAILAPVIRTVVWDAVLGASAVGSEVRIRLAADAALVEEELRVACAGSEEARALAGAIEQARLRVRTGPFRS